MAKLLICMLLISCSVFAKDTKTSNPRVTLVDGSNLLFNVDTLVLSHDRATIDVWFIESNKNVTSATFELSESYCPNKAGVLKMYLEHNKIKYLPWSSTHPGLPSTVSYILCAALATREVD